MEATIKAISPNGVWNGMDKKLVTMSTGEQYTFFVKSGDDFGYNLGDRIEFEVTNEQYKNAKPIRKKTSNYRPQQVAVGQSRSKDDLIMRQTALKASVELHRGNDAFRVDAICEDAEYLFQWLKS